MPANQIDIFTAVRDDAAAISDTVPAANVPASAAPAPVAAIPHPGFLWLNEAACGDLDESEGVEGSALALFFVDAGHVISEETLNVCRACPVRRECIIHAYKGGPGGTPITGGYMGGFSLGQRKSMSLEQALERATTDLPKPIRKR